MSLANTIIVGGIAFFALILFAPRVMKSTTWQATVTPLASIIGSGFLVSAPLLILASGSWAAVTMLIIVITAYLLGNVMRYNIQHLEPHLRQSQPLKFVTRLENTSRPALGIAYMISVAFYLKLLAVFALRGFGSTNIILENSITTSILIFINIIGYFKGLHILEVFEKYAVNIKLCIIGALLVGFFYFNISEVISNQWSTGDASHLSGFESFRQLLGILIIIQGFETSRFLGSLYTSEMRIKTMKYAQILSGLIYVIFIALSISIFKDVRSTSETVIIDLSKIVAPILPFFLIIAAIMSQFSAAVADSIGSSGLISEATNKIISTKQGVVITVGVAIALIWLTNVYEIIVIASKAFAIYYGIQCLIAARLAHKNHDSAKQYLFFGLFSLMMLVVILGKSVE
jgi:hypothetical protein